ncbi:phage virion morphogenesis protein [Desulfocastanea catecholica]
MISVLIDDDQVYGALDQMAALLDKPRAVMREITGVLADAAEDQFAAEGKPQWQALAPATIARRTRQKTWPGRILQVSGGLAASITTQATDSSAAIGSNKVYAAIQQLGGKAGRGKKVTIPARPYLVFGSGEAEETLDILRQHIRHALR